MAGDSSSREQQKVTSATFAKQNLFWIIAFNYANLLDALLTIFIIKDLGGHELNPLMAILLGISPLIFFSFKVVFGGLATWLLIRQRKLSSLKFATGLFSLVVLWNIVMGLVKLHHMVR